MPTLHKLWHQRVRWHRGTLDEVRKYGLSRLTAFDYFCQMMLLLSVLMRALFLIASALTLGYVHSYRLSWLWLAFALFIGAFMHTSWLVLASAMAISTGYAGWRLLGGLRRRNAHQH